MVGAGKTLTSVLAEELLDQLVALDVIASAALARAPGLAVAAEALPLRLTTGPVVSRGGDGVAGEVDLY